MAGSILELRRKVVLQFLAEANEFVTIGQIAEKIGVSRRTILREMDGVAEWLGGSGFRLVSKPGMGVRIDGGVSERQRLQQRLHGENPEVVNLPRDRQKLILIELMQQKEPVKLYGITSRLGVSASTVSSDLDKVASWLSNYGLRLVRKTGSGVHVEGEETDLRRAMIALLYENTSEEELMRLIKETAPNRSRRASLMQISVRNRLLDLIDRATIEQIETMVYALEKRLPHRLAESACIGLMVHLALAVQRLKTGERITIDAVLLAELRRTEEFRYALEIAAAMAEAFGLEVPEDEVGYVTMHLKGARLYEDTVQAAEVAAALGDALGREELEALALQMIEVVESEFHLSLRDDGKLLQDLVTHLDPTMRRLEFNLDIRNPLLDKLKELFPEVYRISGKAAAVLSERIGKTIPDAEIGFLSMHFGAAIEKRRGSFEKRFRVVVACPSGIGSSRLLSARLEKEFPDMEIADVVSTFTLSRAWLDENRISLVISTIPLEDCPIRCLCVNPLLPEEDRMAVSQAVRRAMPRTPREQPAEGAPLMENIGQVLRYSHFIADILEHHEAVIDERAGSMEALARKLAGLLTEDVDDRDELCSQMLEHADMIVTGDCAVITCSSAVLPWHAFLLCRADPAMLSAFCRKPVRLLAVLVSPEELVAREEGMVRDFCRYVGGNFQLDPSLRSPQAGDLRDRLYALLNALYMTKLYDWRAGLHA